MIHHDRIDTVLLYDKPCGVAGAPLLLDLNAAQGLGAAGFEPRLSPHDGYALYENDGVHISIRETGAPQPAEEFTRALDAPITQNGRVKFAPRVRRHKSAVLISVGLGSLRFERDPDRSERFGGGMFGAGMTDTTQMRQLIALSHKVTRCLVQAAPPLAVHWRQSNRLLSAEQIEQEAQAEIPVSYCYNPMPFSSGTRIAGQIQAGLGAHGSEHLVGRTLILHESGLSFGQGCRLIEAAMRLVVAGQARFDTSKSVAIDGWPACELRRRPPSAAFPAGTLELTPDTRPTARQAQGSEDRLRRVFGRAAPKAGGFDRSFLGRFSQMRSALAR